MALSNAHSGGFSMLGRQPLTRLEQINRAEESMADRPLDLSPQKIKAAVARDTALLSGARLAESDFVGSA